MKKSARAGGSEADSCQLSARHASPRVWTSQALLCRSCHLGCMTCMCSSQAVSSSLPPLFYFFTLPFLGIHPSPRIPLGLQRGPWSASRRRPGLVLDMSGSPVALPWSTRTSPPQVSLCLESEALLSLSLDEKLTNLLLQTAPTCSVASYCSCKLAHLQNGDETSLTELSGRLNERIHQTLGPVSSIEQWVHSERGSCCQDRPARLSGVSTGSVWT